MHNSFLLFAWKAVIVPLRASRECALIPYYIKISHVKPVFPAMDGGAYQAHYFSAFLWSWLYILTRLAEPCVQIHNSCLFKTSQPPVFHSSQRPELMIPRGKRFLFERVSFIFATVKNTGLERGRSTMSVRPQFLGGMRSRAALRPWWSESHMEQRSPVSQANLSLFLLEPLTLAPRLNRKYLEYSSMYGLIGAGS